VIAVLVALVTTVALIPQGLVTGLIETLLVGLLACEIDRSGQHLSLRIVTAACLALPPTLRSDYEAQWRDHVLTAGEHGLRPLLVALSVGFRAAPALAFRYRFRPRIASHVLLMFAGFLCAWVAVLSAAISVIKAMHRPPGLVNRAIWPMALLASVTVPVLLIPGIRAATWPNWLVLLVGGLCFSCACAGELLGVRSMLGIVCDTELILYVLGIPLVAPLLSQKSGYVGRVFRFIAGQA
jgi:hypothetical protein